jgi:DNA repair exonuclease SbcCD ATPase subunit
MEILNIQIENFLIIGQADITLSNRGLCRIAGENSDDTTSSSNGSGKSSIIEGIYWCLFGETLRNIKAADGVVNRKTKKNCSVVLEFSEEGTLYRVERYRKHSKHKNNLYLYVNGVDSRGKDNRDTQKYIESVIGMDKMSFANSVVFGQGHSKNLKRFSEMTDSEKKETLESILNLEVFVKSYEFVKTSLKELGVARDGAARRAKELFEQMSSSEEKLAAALKKAEEFDTTKAAEISSLEEKERGLEETIAGLRERVSNLGRSLGDGEEVEQAINIAESILVEHTDRKSALAELYTEKRNKDLLTKRGIERDVGALEAKVEALMDPEHDGEVCSSCGQRVTKEGLHLAKDGYEFDIQDMTRSVKVLDKRLEKLKQGYEAKKSSIEEDIAQVNEFICEQKDHLKEVGTLKNKHLELTYKLSSREEMLETYRETIATVKSSENVWKKAASEYAEEISKLTDRVAEFEKEVEKIDTDINYYTFWKKAFSRTGIRSYLLDQIVPFLNDRVGHYLDILTDGGIEATFHTVKELASGEKRENFNLEITNKNAADTYEGNSGGEKRRIDLGVALGFNDFLASRSGKRFNLLLLDEVFEGVDADGLYYVIKVLEDIARRKSSVFVITHRDELKSYFSDEILLKRNDGLSYVEGTVEQ